MSPFIEENVSLKKYNTFGIDVKARWLAQVSSEKELQELLHDEIAKTQPLLILGGGSNILFTKDFDGLVIKMSIKELDVAVTGEEILVTAGAGVVWNDLVQYCVKNGYAGLENLSLIPGTVGASPIQNIGAYGIELKDVFYSCTAFDIASGKLQEFSYADCGFGYRDSVFKSRYKGRYIITAVKFLLSRSPKFNLQYGAIQAELAKRSINDPTIADISRVVSEIRVSKLPDPSTIGNAGSFFKNPVIASEEFLRLKAAFPEVVHFPAGDEKVKLAAGWLIEQCGFKGAVCGNTGTWKNQALVLVNHGAATGSEVYSFSEQIISTVQKQFGIHLEREVNIL